MTLSEEPQASRPENSHSNHIDPVDERTSASTLTESTEPSSEIDLEAGRPCRAAAVDDDTKSLEHELSRAHSSPRTNSKSHDSTTSSTHEEENPPARPTSSVYSYRPKAKSVPISQRRGLLGRVTLIPEVDDPKLYTRRTKWFLTFCVALGAVAAPLGSTIFFPALEQVTNEFHTNSSALTNLSVALYMLSMSIFPLWWSAFSEALGRRTVYIISFALFFLWNILCARSTSIAMLIVMRVLAGGAAASVQAVGAGTIADLWEVKERGRAMGIFYLGPLCGPLLGPIAGGALSQVWGWRSTQYFLAIYGGATWVMLLLFLPETLAKTKIEVIAPTTETSKTTSPSDDKESPVQLTRTLSRRSVAKKTSNLVFFIRKFIFDPLRVILYLRFPAVALTVTYASVTFASLYILNISIQAVFEVKPYSYSTLIVGLLYIPNSLGYVVASIFGGKWTDSIMAREARKAGRIDERGRLEYRPEDRLRENAWVGAVMYPVALVWYGWTAQEGVIWIVPMIANFFFGVGSMLIFSAATTMLTEFLPKRASSGVALNNFVRNICSCVGGIIAQPLIDSIGNGWLFTILGVLTICASSIVWAMRRFGPGWRAGMEKGLAEMDKHWK